MILELYAFISLFNFVVKLHTDMIVEERIKNEDFIIKKEDKKAKRLIKYALESMIPIYHLYDIYNKTYNIDDYYYQKRREGWKNGTYYKEDNKYIKNDNNIKKNNDKVNYHDINEKNNEKDKVLVKKKTYKR